MSAHGQQKISVIIPTLNEAQRLPVLIEALRKIDDFEIIIADGGSNDATVQIARENADILVACEKGRGTQINAGAARASGDIYWILHADCIPPELSGYEIRRILANPQIRLGAFAIKFDAAHPLLTFYGWASTFDSLLSTFGDQGYFLRAKDFHHLGIMPNWPLFEDVESRIRIRRFGKIQKSKHRIVTSSRRFLHRGVIVNQLINASLLVQFLFGSDPRWLSHKYKVANAQSAQPEPNPTHANVSSSDLRFFGKTRSMRA